MKKIGILFPVVAAVLLVGAACSNTNSNTNAGTNSNTNTANTNVSTANSNANTNAATTSGKLTVTLPVKDATLTSPFKMTGTADQGTIVFINLRNSAGKTLVSTTASVVSGKWTVNAMTYKFSAKTTGDIEVYQQNKTTKAKLFDTVLPVTFN